MFGEPVARVAELVGELREIDRVAQSLALVEPVETGERSSTESW